MSGMCVHSSLHHCCYVDAWGVFGSWEGPMEMLKDNMGGGVELHQINNTIAHCQRAVSCSLFIYINTMRSLSLVEAITA